MTVMTANRQVPITWRLGDSSPAGGWWLFARPKNAQVADITFFRNAPTLLGSFSFEDPFGPKDMTLTLPNVSVFDRIGYGDLYWFRKKVSIDAVWATELPAAYGFGRYAGSPTAPTWLPSFVWSGYITGFNYTPEGMEVSLKGAMYQLDDYLAKPEFPSRPLPYEYAMARQFLDRSHLRLSPLQVQWPSWWTTTYTPPAKGTPTYLIPSGVKKGDKWSTLVTRSTGSWEPALSSYIQTLLNAMYTRRGRWTLDLQPGRVPVLLHRDMLLAPDNSTVIVDAVNPHVDITNLSIDWSQSIDVAYGQGTSLAGVAYSGMQISSSGDKTSYVPLAATRQAFPEEDNNEWLDLFEMPREVQIQMQPGLSEYDASKVALAHLERFGDPGVTGELVLKGDVSLGSGDVVPHHLVRAGMSVQIRNVFGMRDGVLAHVTANTVDVNADTNTLSIDSRYRDALTAEEVKVRGRDALAVSRMLIGGQYTPPLPDNLLPWNYAEGSGMIPTSPAPGPNAAEFFHSMPDGVQFPWTAWTKRYPPKSGRGRHYYIRIGPASSNADNNWASQPRATAGRFSIPIKMAQAGTIRLFQMAAYDRDGNVLKVPFHVSFYYMKNTGVQAMPKIPAYNNNPSSANYYPYHHPPYAVSQHYPYVVAAFEDYNLDGTEKGIEVPRTVQTAALWKAFGSDKVKAGYFPGDGYTGSPTGLLVEENLGSFNTVQYGGFNPYTPRGNLTNPDAGMLYCMVYCDAQAEREVFFLGRMFRAEPGSSGGE